MSEKHEALVNRYRRAFPWPSGIDNGRRLLRFAVEQTVAGNIVGEAAERYIALDDNGDVVPTTTLISWARYVYSHGEYMAALAEAIALEEARGQA